MIYVNERIIKQETFGDGTLKCSVPQLLQFSRLFQSTLSTQFVYLNNDKNVCIKWCYDNDSELFCLWSIVMHIREKYPDLETTLIMPYIPHARQDRNVSDRLFTLKYFSEIINLMNFKNVFVFDPHSDVSLALLNKVRVTEFKFNIHIPDENGVSTIMFPDIGAAKKYSSFYSLGTKDNPFIIGNKHRNADGRIESYELMNFVEGTKKVVIRDDICSYGGTFVCAAKELRKRGVEEIILVVSHCENNILKGEVFEYIDNVYTTDSICTISHPKLIVEKKFRGGDNV